MDSDRKIAIIAGVLFIIGTIAGNDFSIWLIVKGFNSSVIAYAADKG